MTIGALYRHFLHELQHFLPQGEADQITKMVFESEANITRSEIIKNPQTELNDQLKEKLLITLTALLNREPVQYILGEAWFYHLQFKVNSSVLIPRPETEELVEQVISFCNNKKGSTILDIGTGSGCIPIAIKKNIPGCSVTSIDVSTNALEVAKKNAAFHQADIAFIELDFLNTLLWNQLPSFDVIVSNPPYIPESEYAEMEEHVKKHEPSLALFVPDTDPLIFYNSIMEFGKTHLLPDGKIFMEIHEKKGEAIQQLFSANGYKVELIKDMFEKDRIVIASLCH